MTESVVLNWARGGPSRRHLRVGSWPGPAFKDNAFISIYCRALEHAGATIVDIADPRRINEQIDVLQVHWAEEVFWRVKGPARLIKAICETLWSIFKLRRRGVRVVWLVHNLQPHDADLFHRWVWRLYSQRLARMVDGYASLSPATLPVVARAFKFGRDVPACSLRHPRYVVMGPTADRSSLRSELRTPPCERLLVFVGSVRRYKGVDRLMAAVGACDPSQVGLVVAGRADDPVLRGELAGRAADLRHVDFRPERLSEEAFAKLVLASDYVVLPFVDSLHSGSVIHALSLGRPVLTPATPFAGDLARTVGAQWVRVYDGELSRQTVSELPQPPDGSPDLSALDETLFGETLAAFYAEVLNRSARPWRSNK